MNLFEIRDKTGRSISLRKRQWQHILIEHPYMSGSLEPIQETLMTPDIIEKSFYRQDVKLYYKHFKNISKYLVVVVKYLNGEGFIITAFYTKTFKKR